MHYAVIILLYFCTYLQILTQCAKRDKEKDVALSYWVPGVFNHTTDEHWQWRRRRVGTAQGRCRATAPHGIFPTFNLLKIFPQKVRHSGWKVQHFGGIPEQN